MKFISTRDKNRHVSGPEAVVYGISPDGGLFVPEVFPTVTEEELASYLGMDYNEIAASVIGKFLPEIDDLKAEIDAAYSRFDEQGPAPLVKVNDGEFFLELWHGPTHAFKDVALTLLPRLLARSKKLLGIEDETLILVATSGDTGKAALEGFRDVDGTSVMVFYPSEGVSEIQKLQMVTQRGNNVAVRGIIGNFDDAQRAVKKTFTDPEIVAKLKGEGVTLGSANSINFGRLVPQIAYYFSSYCDLVNAGEIKQGERVNFCVPTGNFGDILAGWYAGRMGLPVGRLISASNINNVISDFIATGKYDLGRKFYKTTSPSMDILISSNLERLLFEISGRDDRLTAERMESLLARGVYSITDEERKRIAEDFDAGYASEERVAKEIADVFNESGYLIDTHTAVAYAVYRDYKKRTGDTAPTVIMSTAGPYKFVPAVLTALGESVPASAAEAIDKLEEISALPVPAALSELPTLPKLHTQVIDKGDVPAAVVSYAATRSRGR